MGAATFEQFSLMARLAWRARARFGGLGALDKLIAKNDLFGAHALIHSGLDGKAWAERPQAGRVMAGSSSPVFAMMLNAGLMPSGLFEARLLAARDMDSPATGSFNATMRGKIQIIDDIQAMTGVGCSWEGQGEKALMTSIGLGLPVGNLLLSLGAGPDGPGCSDRLRSGATHSKDRAIQSKTLHNGRWVDDGAEEDAVIELLRAHFERFELGQASEEAGPASSAPKRRL